MTTSVRLDPATERLLEEVVEERGLTKSEVIREALRLVAETKRRRNRGRRPYEAFRGVIGRVRGGPADLSERTGERFRRILLDGRKRS
jgi:Arc/MetJ-type ribon-helix-helix transcriptional regulator